jgi:hypothetical protein
MLDLHVPTKRLIPIVSAAALVLVTLTLALALTFSQAAPAGQATPLVVASPTATPLPSASPTPSPPSPTPYTPSVEPTTETGTPQPTPERLQLADLPPMSLQDFPRPPEDNGLCIHFLAKAYYDDPELDLNVWRMKDMRMKWALALYADEQQLAKAATRFRDAGIFVVWRKYARPYKPIFGLADDVRYLQSIGMPPYLQLYNEPNLPAEWDNRPIDKQLFLNNLIRAMADVYNAGGYVGLQFVDEEWLVAALREVKARGGEAIFKRMFFIPHPYGLNHPPNYTADSNSVLGFRYYADIFQREIGFVPPMIAGEGGWKWNATNDSNYPTVDAERHAQYHKELFLWFKTGVLSDGQPLPDYLFAFCPWLLAGTKEGKMDDSAWYDSYVGNHEQTIAAVKSIAPFRRKFSWDE